MYTLKLIYNYNRYKKWYKGLGGTNMPDEKFQSIVLEKLTNLEEGQSQLIERVDLLEKGQNQLVERVYLLEKGQKQLEEEQREIRKSLDAVIEQTAYITEFREEANKKLDILIEENEVFKEIIGKHEVDIRTLKRIII